MYLNDAELRRLLPQIAAKSEAWAEAFDPDTQVQPASIDMRLSATFWRPLKRFAIDLRRSQLLEVEPRRYYRKVTLPAGGTLLLKPFELLLGRTLEAFSVPEHCAGELVGRSSFARLGLQVSAAGGYINPGWRGHMPLQLVNFGPNPIRLVPGLAICQVRFVTLTARAERPYGHHALGSKYVDDDGGPSYWWRDKRVKRLHAMLATRSVEDHIQAEIHVVMGRREPEVIERLERRVSGMRVEDLESAQSILAAFAGAEERRRTLRRWGIRLSRGLFPVAVTGGLWIASREPLFQWWHFLTWSVSAALLAVSVYAFRTEVGDHFGRQELRASGSPDGGTCQGDGSDEGLG